MKNGDAITHFLMHIFVCGIGVKVIGYEAIVICLLIYFIGWIINLIFKD